MKRFVPPLLRKPTVDLTDERSTKKPKIKHEQQQSGHLAPASNSNSGIKFVSANRKPFLVPLKTSNENSISGSIPAASIPDAEEGTERYFNVLWYVQRFVEFL
jgi:hypothetical protein